MAEQEAAQVDEEPEATEEASAEDSGMADAVDERAAELTGGAESGDDQPISEINRGAVDAATEHLDDANLADDRETLKKLQQGM